MDLLMKMISAIATTVERGVWSMPLVLRLLAGHLQICRVPEFSSPWAPWPLWPLQSPQGRMVWPLSGLTSLNGWL